MSSDTKIEPRYLSLNTLFDTINTYYDRKSAYVIKKNGNMETNMAPWIPYAKEYNFTIKKGLIQTVFEPKPQLETNFKVATGNNSIRGKVRK